MTSVEQWSRWLDLFVRIVTAIKCPRYFSYLVNSIIKPCPICPGLIKRKRPHFRWVRRYTIIVERVMTQVASACGVSKGVYKVWVDNIKILDKNMSVNALNVHEQHWEGVCSRRCGCMHKCCCTVTRTSTTKSVHSSVEVADLGSSCRRVPRDVTRVDVCTTRRGRDIWQHTQRITAAETAKEQQNTYIERS